MRDDANHYITGESGQLSNPMGTIGTSNSMDDYHSAIKERKNKKKEVCKIGVCIIDDNII